MRQYEFEAIHRTRGNVERLRATARTAQVARWHIVNYYGDQFDVMELHRDINPPHHIAGEIDASSPAHEQIALTNPGPGRQSTHKPRKTKA